ncbi:hypothetical protein T12_4178 [Trichinella patagoniensis]|uniref:Uncharacterized protein n=1 Tax=Trichinella patagoniensis TaxID=990121 RepID=A0A0V0Z7H9_9BILA|nr:hypothetical protein T12_4178 [Trichinella patagoniensis]
MTEFRALRCHWRSASKITLFIQIQFLQCAYNRDLNKPKYQHLGGSSVRCARVCEKVFDPCQLMIIFILRITLFICAGGWVPAKTASSDSHWTKEVASFLTHKYIRHAPADMWMENYSEIVTSIRERERLNSAICNPEIGSVATTFQIFQTDYSVF